MCLWALCLVSAMFLCVGADTHPGLPMPSALCATAFRLPTDLYTVEGGSAAFGGPQADDGSIRFVGDRFEIPPATALRKEDTIRFRVHQRTVARFYHRVSGGGHDIDLYVYSSTNRVFDNLVAYTRPGRRALIVRAAPLRAHKNTHPPTEATNARTHAPAHTHAPTPSRPHALTRPRARAACSGSIDAESVLMQLEPQEEDYLLIVSYAKMTAATQRELQAQQVAARAARLAARTTGVPQRGAGCDLLHLELAMEPMRTVQERLKCSKPASLPPRSIELPTSTSLFGQHLLTEDHIRRHVDTNDAHLRYPIALHVAPGHTCAVVAYVGFDFLSADLRLQLAAPNGTIVARGRPHEVMQRTGSIDFDNFENVMVAHNLQGGQTYQMQLWAEATGLLVVGQLCAPFSFLLEGLCSASSASDGAAAGGGRPPAASGWPVERGFMVRWRGAGSDTGGDKCLHVPMPERAGRAGGVAAPADGTRLQIWDCKYSEQGAGGAAASQLFVLTRHGQLQWRPAAREPPSAGSVAGYMSGQVEGHEHWKCIVPTLRPGDAHPLTDGTPLQLQPCKRPGRRGRTPGTSPSPAEAAALQLSAFKVVGKDDQLVWDAGEGDASPSAGKRMCLDVPEGRAANGQTLQLWSCQPPKGKHAPPKHAPQSFEAAVPALWRAAPALLRQRARSSLKAAPAIGGETGGGVGTHNSARFAFPARAMTAQALRCPPLPAPPTPPITHPPTLTPGTRLQSRDAP